MYMKNLTFMKTNVWAAGLALAGVGALASGCAEPRTEYVPVYRVQPAYVGQPGYPPPAPPPNSGPGVAPAGPTEAWQQPAAAPVPMPAQPAPPPQAVVEAPSLPPPAPIEVISSAPNPYYVWVSGYYAWNGRWVWVSGRWVVRPRPTAVWVGGHWTRHGYGYVWIGGGWR